MRFTEEARIRIWTHLWVAWAEAAIEREVEARIARNYGRAAEDSRDQSAALGWETRAALQSIAAAAISLDDLGHEIWPMLPEPRPEARPRAARILEILNRGFCLGPLVGSGDLNRRLRPLFDSRKTALHYQGDWSDPVPHPSGTTAGQEDARYSLEQAEAAVDTLLLVLTTCVENSREITREWAKNMKGSVENLVQIRGVGPSTGLVGWYRREELSEEEADEEAEE